MLRAFAIVTALFGAAPAWSGGTLRVYNRDGLIAADTMARFEAETGIRVSYEVYDSDEALEARLLAGRSGYDLVVPGSGFLRRQIPAGLYQPLDRARLPGWDDLDPTLMAAAAADDPGNAYGVIYLWGVGGIGYDVEKVTARLGADAPVRSLALVFDPANAAKLADCGIALRDSAAEMVPLALAYLGLPPDSLEPGDLDRVAALFAAVRPYVAFRAEEDSGLAEGAACVAVGFSGDGSPTAGREAGKIGFAVPDEGAMLRFDMLAIPADAPDPEAAHALIAFLLRPDIVAGVTSSVLRPNANLKAAGFVKPRILADPAIYPPADVRARLFAQPVQGPRGDRALERLWAEIRRTQ